MRDEEVRQWLERAEGKAAAREARKLRRFGRFLDGLPVQMRRCVRLRVFHDLDYDAIAEILQIAPATVKVQLFKARKRLQMELPAVSEDWRMPLTEKLRSFAEVYFSEKANSCVLGPTLDDFELEYTEALTSGGRWRARWVLLRGYWSFAAAIAANLTSTVLARLRSRFGRVEPPLG